MQTTLILIAVFVATLMLVFLASNFFVNRQQLRKNIDTAKEQTKSTEGPSEEILSSESDSFRYYFDTVRNADANSTELRLVRAGYFGRDSVRVYNRIRMIVTAASFAVALYILTPLLSSFNPAISFLFAGMVASVVFILMNAFLDGMINRQKTLYQRLFPDFMDLLIVCVDAGMSIEAAIDRVAQEMLKTEPTFGHHVAIINLELRAGRPLHEALVNFAQRVGLDEANSLAVLFRQSQELGSSVVKTLRVFSDEMRRMRILRAEEKANALPVKMLFPMAGFLFPVNIMIVLIPIMIQLLELISTMGPQPIQ
ncbi:type II secretion system F family protein [Thioclava sp. FR2]|uniref:type II secretion system F family protein n=1 Tax=Thioclava sp. FR2 TaxID=3445780 RepID=UPI003EB9D2C5